MSIIRFDSVGGASGDMILAALLGLGVNLKQFRKTLSSLDIGSFSIVPGAVSDYGLNGQKIAVRIPHEHHPHRHLSDIRKLITKSGLPAEVKALSMKVFERLGAAEAKVHNTTIEEIHFHEVGAMDSIIDIAGSCLCLHMLGVKTVEVGALPLGHGTIKCAHGVLPSPAPATVALLAGFPVVNIDEPFETVTPTGAALLVTWARELKEDRPGTRRIIKTTSHGFGSRKLTGRPNLLRATLCERVQVPDSSHDDCLVLECNLDDVIPELIGALTIKLLKQGALDVFTTPIQMKKQRPGTLLTVLCKPENRDELLDLIFRETTTFGVREHMTARTTLQRRSETVKTPYGPVRVKIGTWKGMDITRSPEHDDCAKAAEAGGVSVRKVYESAQRTAKAP